MTTFCTLFIRIVSDVFMCDSVGIMLLINHGDIVIIDVGIIGERLKPALLNWWIRNKGTGLMIGDGILFP